MSELNLKIDKEKCIKCGACARICKSGCIYINKEGFPIESRRLLPFCIKCQHCLAICPTGALSVFGKNPQDSVLKKDFVKAEDLRGLIEYRRSCRFYKQENVPQETINKLKDMLAFVPTGRNNHSLHFALITDIKDMEVFKQIAEEKLKKVIKFLPSFGIIKKYKKLLSKGVKSIFQDAPHLIVVCVDKKAPCKKYDPIIALSYFELYAQTLGLGTLWCGLAYGLLKFIPSLQKYLNIPKTHEVCYVMLFGLPSVSFARGTQPKKCTFSEFSK